MQLITRMDFDGLMCTAMITRMETIHEINFSNPADVDNRMIDIDFGDALVHLPFHPDAGMWFFNHEPRNVTESQLKGIRGKYEKAPSTARLVYRYYNSPDLAKYEEIIEDVDRIQSANLTRDDIVSPRGWVLLSYTLDPRFEQERDYGMLLIEVIREGRSAEEILAMQSVSKRIDRYKKDEETYAGILSKFTKTQGNVIITDFRNLKNTPHGNRFFVFTKYPDGNVHLRVEELDRMRVRISLGKSMINRTCNVNIGELLEEFGGGGIEGAGTCILGQRTADARIAQLVEKLKD